MIQQLIALALIIIFIWKLIVQKNKKKININEFIFWLIFWIAGLIAIIFIKDIDKLVKNLGFSGTGINFLLYLAVIVMFYLIFKNRLQIAKINKDITKIVREKAIDDKK